MTDQPPQIPVDPAAAAEARLDRCRAAYNRLVRAALHAAITGPRRRDRYSLKASISHDALAELRGALDDLGYDWRAIRRRLDESR